MIFLIGGASHTGKTLLAQKLLEKYAYPYLSIDHLKMGLIRSGKTTLTPSDDDALTLYLWPIVREIIKTAIENHQNLIVEGCYIPLTYQEDFSKEYLRFIRFLCLVFSEPYIRAHYSTILENENVIETRLESTYTLDAMIADNTRFLQECIKKDVPYLLIDKDFAIAEYLEKF